MNNKLIYKNVSFVTIMQIMNYLFPLVTIPIVSRNLGPEVIGHVNYVVYFSSFFVLIVNYGFRLSGVRRIASARIEDTSKITSIIFYCKLLLCIISILSFYLISSFSSVFNENDFLFQYSIIVCFSSVITMDWVFQAKHDIRIYAIVNVLIKSITLCMIILLIKNENHGRLYLLILSLSVLSSAIMMFLFSIKKYKLKLEKVKLSEMVNYFREDRYIFFSGLATIMYTTMGVLVLGNYHSQETVGYYTSALKLMEVMKGVLIMPLFYVFFPLLSKNLSNDTQVTLYKIRCLVPILFIMAVIIVILSVTFSSVIINILFGSQFYEASKLFKILSIGFVFILLGNLFGGGMMLNLGLDKQFVYIQVFVSILSLTMSLIFIKNYGAEIVAIIWVISEMTIVFLQILVLSRNGFNPISKEFIKWNSLKNSVNLLVSSKK